MSWRNRKNAGENKYNHGVTAKSLWWHNKGADPVVTEWTASGYHSKTEQEAFCTLWQPWSFSSCALIVVYKQCCSASNPAGTSDPGNHLFHNIHSPSLPHKVKPSSQLLGTLIRIWSLSFWGWGGLSKLGIGIGQVTTKIGLCSKNSDESEISRRCKADSDEIEKPVWKWTLVTSHISYYSARPTFFLHFLQCRKKTWPVKKLGAVQWYYLQPAGSARCWIQTMSS